MSPDSTPSNERLVNRSMGPLTPAVLAEASQRHGEAERQREALEAEHLKVHRQQVTDSLEELVGECIAPLTNLDQSRLQRFFAAEIGPLLRLLEAEDARNEDLISSCQELGGGASEPMEQTSKETKDFMSKLFDAETKQDMASMISRRVCGIMMS